MTRRDSQFTIMNWPGNPSMSLEWICGTVLPSEDIRLPTAYFFNPDEAEDTAIQGPSKDKVQELWDELNIPALTEHQVDSYRFSAAYALI